MNGHRSQPEITAWVRREFERIARRNRGHNIRIGQGRKIHASISAKLLGIEVIRPRCGSTPANGPIVMEAIDKPITCATCLGRQREQAPTLF